MKKLACILLVVCISVSSSFAKGSGRKYIASLDNDQAVKAQKSERRELKSFGSGRRYSAVTRGHGLHLFGRRNGGGGTSRPESGLGL